MKTVMSGAALAAILALAMPAWAQGTDAQQPNNPPNASASMPHAKKANATHAQKISHKNMKHAAHAGSMHGDDHGSQGRHRPDRQCRQPAQPAGSSARDDGRQHAADGQLNMGPTGNPNMGPTGNPNMAPMGAPNPQRSIQGQFPQSLAEPGRGTGSAASAAGPPGRAGLGRPAGAAPPPPSA